MDNDYLTAVKKGMKLLASHPKTLFVGQAMCYPGHAITGQVKDFPKNQLVEFPVAEEMQTGFCLGLAMEGYIPVCIYPRCNFAILAANQIVNHIDKWKEMGCGDVHIIIKMVVGAEIPLDPGHQHKANYVEAFKSMCDNIEIVDYTRNNPQMRKSCRSLAIDDCYKRMIEVPGRYLVVEDAVLYDEKT